MFNFLKKGRSVAASEDVPVAQPVVDHDKLVAEAAAIVPQVEAAEGVAKADLLDKRGELLARAGEADEAILAFEESIEVEKRMGAAYKGLTALYNQKRREAAAAKDDAATKEWFDKLQALMQSSKDMLRGK